MMSFNKHLECFELNKSNRGFIINDVMGNASEMKDQIMAEYMGLAKL